MESLGPQCTAIKRKYEDCFNVWYAEKFLKGNVSSNDCEPLFREYQACLYDALKKKRLDALLKEHGHDIGHKDSWASADTSSHAPSPSQ